MNWALKGVTMHSYCVSAETLSIYSNSQPLSVHFGLLIGIPSEARHNDSSWATLQFQDRDIVIFRGQYL